MFYYYFLGPKKNKDCSSFWQQTFIMKHCTKSQENIFLFFLLLTQKLGILYYASCQTVQKLDFQSVKGFCLCVPKVTYKVHSLCRKILISCLKSLKMAATNHRYVDITIRPSYKLDFGKMKLSQIFFLRQKVGEREHIIVKQGPQAEAIFTVPPTIKRNF